MGLIRDGGMDPDPAVPCRGYVAGKVGSTSFSRITSGRAAQPRSLIFIAALPSPGAAAEPFPSQKCPCKAALVN